MNSSRTIKVGYLLPQNNRDFWQSLEVSDAQYWTNIWEEIEIELEV